MLSALPQRDEQIAESDVGEELLRTVPGNVVQSIRAFRVVDLQSEAVRLNHHFLYANLSQALTRQQVLATLAESFYIPKSSAKNFDALRDCLTEQIQRAGQQPGFLIVLDQLPQTQKFDREARENLLDVFRDAADYWADKRVPFRVFFSFD
jgi:RNAse (barnase) inhibitor barstar